MLKMKILIVDDEQDLCEILQFNLTSAGYHADVAYSAEEALSLIPSAYDLLLLDVMMPGMSGFELARKLKAEPSTAHLPIIFLTAKDTEEDTLRGFSLGADDYVAKPFSIREVLARVKAVLTRSSAASVPAAADPNLVHYEELTLDVKGKSVTVEGQPIGLTRTEYEVLRFLLNHRGQVFSRQQLLSKVWPSGVVVTIRTVDVTIARLRKKLGSYSNRLVSKQGFGYYFKKEENG